MGKALSAWERSRRLAERERERERASQSRARERRAARDEREKERASIRRERDYERERRRHQREAELASERDAKSAQVEGWRTYVASFDAYLRRLSSLHRVRFQIDAARAEYEKRRRTVSYVAPAPFASGRFPDAHVEARKYPAVPWRKSRFAATGAIASTLISLLVLILGGALIVVLRSDARWWLVLLGVGWVAAVASVDRVTHARWNSADRLRRQVFADQERRRAELLEMHETEHRKRFVELEAERLKNYESTELENQAKFEANESIRVDILDAAKDGSLAAIGLICEAAFPLPLTLSPPDDLTSSGVEEHSVAYQVIDATTLRLLIEVPDDGLVPDRRVEMTPSNERMRFKEFSARARAETYEAFVASLALRYVVESFRAVPSLDVVLVEVTVPSLEGSSGKVHDLILAQGQIEAAALSEVDLLNADPVEVLRALGGSLRAIGKRAVDLSSNGDFQALTWASVGDVGFEIPYGLLPDCCPHVAENSYRHPDFDGYDLSEKRELEAEQDMQGMLLDPMRADNKEADYGRFNSGTVGGGVIYLCMVGLTFSDLLTASVETGKLGPPEAGVVPAQKPSASAPKTARVGNTRDRAAGLDAGASNPMGLVSAWVGFLESPRSWRVQVAANGQKPLFELVCTTTSSTFSCKDKCGENSGQLLISPETDTGAWAHTDDATHVVLSFKRLCGKDAQRDVRYKLVQRSDESFRIEGAHDWQIWKVAK